MAVSRRYVVFGLVALALVAGAVAFLRHRRVAPVRAATLAEAPQLAPARPRDRGDVPAEDPGLLVDDDRGGDLRLEGLVLDAAGVPAPGATVTVSSSPPRSVVSGEDGSFVVEKLAGRRYKVSARAAAGVAGPVTVRLSATSDPVTLRLVAAASVEVHVVDATSQRPVAGATVELRGVTTLTGTTDAQGQLVLASVASGMSQVVAWAPGFARAFVTLNVPRQSGGAPVVATQEVKLHAGAAASGTVRTSDGHPVAGALVSFAATSAWLGRADPRRDAVTTDANGAYHFDALPAGSFRFTARHEQHAPGFAEAVRLDGVTPRSGIDIVMETGVIVVGQVVSRAGAPVPGAVVRIAARAEGPAREPARQTYSDDQGHFEMAGLPRTHLRLVALHESATSETVELEPSQDRISLVLTLELDGAISGTVVDSHGEPVEGAEVFALPALAFGGGGGSDAPRGRRGGGGGPGGAFRAERELRGGLTEPTDVAGRFTLRGLRPGAYQLRASRAGQRGAAMLREPTAAKVGDTSVKIELPADGGVRGKVLFADGHAPALFTIELGLGAGGATPFASGDGSFELDGLPPGDQSLQVGGPEFDRKTVHVTVVADHVADAGTIQVVRGRRISGRVLADGQPVGGATVYAGRRLGGDGSAPSTTGWGPPGVGASKSTTSDTDGSFVLEGVGAQTLALLADHETLGRSPTIQVPAGQGPVLLDLVLAPFGALEGTVRQGGTPVEGAIVTASSQNAPGTYFNVPSGSDGSFRFDRLAPDNYLVSATPPPRGRGFGMVFNTVVATVKSGQTAEVTLAVPVGNSTLLVRPVRANGQDLQTVAFVYVAAFPLAAKSQGALEAEIAAHGAGTHAKLVAFMGRPAREDNLVPGNYTACVAPLPAEVRGVEAVAEYDNREGDRLPVFCLSTTVAEGEQTFSVPVDLPAFVPAP